MNGVKQKRLVKSIAKLAARCCSYIGDRCDCKFIDDTTSESSIMTRSESGSGCPELMTVALIIAAMTEQEYNSIAKRASINISSDSENIDAFEILRAEKKKRDDALRQAAPASKKTTRPKHKTEVWSKKASPNDLTKSMLDIKE